MIKKEQQPNKPCKLKIERQQDQCERLGINETQRPHLLQHYIGKETRRIR